MGKERRKQGEDEPSDELSWFSNISTTNSSISKYCESNLPETQFKYKIQIPFIYDLKKKIFKSQYARQRYKWICFVKKSFQAHKEVNMIYYFNSEFHLPEHCMKNGHRTNVVEASHTNKPMWLRLLWQHKVKVNTGKPTAINCMFEISPTSTKHWPNISCTKSVQHFTCLNEAAAATVKYWKQMFYCQLKVNLETLEIQRQPQGSVLNPPTLLTKPSLNWSWFVSSSGWCLLHNLCCLIHLFHSTCGLVPAGTNNIPLSQHALGPRNWHTWMECSRR